MPSKGHICVVTPSFNIGGIERTVSEFANFFHLKGYEVTLISLLSGKKYFKINAGIRVIEPKFNRSNSTLKNLVYRIRLFFFIRNKVKAYHPVVVLSMSDTFNYLVIGSLLGLPCKVFIGDVTKPDRKLALLTRMGKRYLYPLATGFIAQTQGAYKYYRNFFGDGFNMRVINGAVKVISNYQIEKEKIILCAGRLSIEKGQDRLIEAFSLLKNTSDWKLVFTADGPFKKQLLGLVANKGLNDNIEFIGKVDDIDLQYAKASIFVLPSRIEGFPNALTEAMAAGLPCVCFNSFPAEEIIDDGIDGYIVIDGNIEELAEKIQLLIDNESLRLSIGKEAMKIRERLSIDNIGGQMLEFIGGSN